jgi:5'-3' exonuclease
MNLSKALVDGDIIVYQIGYASEEDEVQIAQGRVDEMLGTIIIATEAIDYSTYLSDGKEGNFRYKVDSNYKAQRVQAKPRHYDAIKQYLIEKHGARITLGIEADDQISIDLQNDPNTISATIDKDILYGVPGNHYSWPIYRKGEVVREAMFIHTTEDEALRFHYLQLLKGDKSDNVRGIDGLGDKKIAKLFEGEPTDKLFSVVADKYKDLWRNGWKEELTRNSKLLWIKRTNDENEQTPVEEALDKLTATETSLW